MYPRIRVDNSRKYQIGHVTLMFHGENGESETHDNCEICFDITEPSDTIPIDDSIDLQGNELTDEEKERYFALVREGKIPILTVNNKLVWKGMFGCDMCQKIIFDDERYTNCQITNEEYESMSPFDEIDCNDLCIECSEERKGKEFIEEKKLQFVTNIKRCWDETGFGSLLDWIPLARAGVTDERNMFDPDSELHKYNYLLLFNYNIDSEHAGKFAEYSNAGYKILDDSELEI